MFKELDLIRNINLIDKEFNDFLDETDEMIANYKEFGVDMDPDFKEIQ